MNLEEDEVQKQKLGLPVYSYVTPLPIKMHNNSKDKSDIHRE